MATSDIIVNDKIVLNEISGIILLVNIPDLNSLYSLFYHVCMSTKQTCRVR